MANNKHDGMRDFMGVTRALADENRVRILMALENAELCVCQIIHLLRLAPSTVSKHISILRQAGLVDSRKEGRWVYYRLPMKTASPTVTTTIRWMRQCLTEDTAIADDRKRLKSIRAMDTQELCKAYPNQCAPISNKAAHR